VAIRKVDVCGLLVHNLPLWSATGQEEAGTWWPLGR